LTSAGIVPACTYTFPGPPATHTITATFTTSNTNFNTSPASNAVNEVVSKTATTTSVASTPNPSAVNQQVAFLATVTPAFAGTTQPTGTVSFTAIGPSPSIAQTAMCTETISGGAVPVCNYTFAASGTYTVVATYNVLTDPNFTTSSSPSSGVGADIQTVNAGSNSVVLSSSLNPSVVNQPVTLNATISVSNSGSAQPTGSVVYADGGTAIPGCTFGSTGSPVTFTGGIVPSCTVGFSSAATHSIVATFTSANSNFTSGASNTVPQVVNKATPVTSVASLPNPAAVGATVTATATVTSPFTAGTAIPSGNVTFATTPATTTCTETIVAGVVPTCSFTFTSKNSYVIVATYLGDSNFAGSASPSSGPSADVEAVGVEATTVTLTSTTPPTSVVNQSVTFTATINLTAGTTTNPTGTVIFKDGATVLCTVGSSGSPATFTGGAVPSCTATLFTATSSTVTHAITASYSGDSNFGPSTGNLTQTVNPAATTTTIVSTVASVASNSAPLNTPVTYSATVTPTPAPTAGSLSPTGTVTFQYAGTNGTLPVAATNLCPPVGVTAASGTATAACVGLLPTAGTYAVTATYNADQNFSGSKTSPANAQTVTKGATTTSVVSSSTTSSVNQSVAFTATVAPSLPGGTAVPTGTVSFAAIGPSPSVAQTAMCTETISGGAVPICNYTFTASGTYTVVATYNVLTDPNFTTSASPSSGAGADVQTVNAGSNSVFLSSSLNPSSVNQPVSFNATINVPNSGTAQPIGSVVYADGGTALPGCTFGSVGTPVTFTNGIVSPCQVPLSSVATHSIVATFTSANSNFTSGASNTISQVVNKATPVTSVVSSPNPSAVNTQVTATATLTLPFTAGTALPSGNVTFATTPATTTCTETIAAGIVPSCSFTFTSKNNYTIVATYPGDSNFNGSASPSSGTGADVQTVSVQTTTVTLTSTLPPPAGSTVNEPVTFNATINLTAGTTTKPTGTVTYYDGATVLCTSGSSSSPATFAGGTVPSCAATLVTGGIHPITAVYSGDSNFSGSTSLILSQNVAAASTATSFTSAPAAVDVNTQVTYTVHIVPTPAGISTSKNPTGTVTFNYTTTPLAGSAPGTPATSGNLCPPTVAVTALTTTPPTYGEATASCTVTLATSGQYTITANYVSGDNNFTGSTVVSSPFTVGATPTTVSLSSSLPTASGAVVSQLVTFTARVVSGKPGPVAPNGTVVFSSTDAANTAGNCGAQPVTAVPNLASPSTGLDGIAHCSVQFPITEQFTAPISITATYVPATSPQDFGASLNTISQTVQNYSVAFTAPGVSSTPPALAPIFVTQGFSNTSDPFNPKTNIAAAVTTSGGFTGGFSDSLNVTCSVTAVAAIPSAGIISGQAVSDPTCAPASQTLATSSATSSYPLTYTVSASATAPIGAYYVTIRVTDSGPQANGNTGAAYSLSETTTTNPIVYVVGESTSLTLAQGAVGVANAVFNTEAAASGSSLVSYACGKVFSTKTGIIANPSSAPVVTCNGPTTTVGAGSNPPSSSLTTVPIQVSLASSATAQLHRSNTVSLAALLGVPLLALVGWLGSRKSPRRNFFRFIGLILLMVGVSYAVTGCGGSFTQTGSQVSSGGLGTNDSPYLVQVIAYDGPNQTGNEYFAVVPLTVNANSSN
jgi:large repetitive protein